MPAAASLPAPARRPPARRPVLGGAEYKYAARLVLEAGEGKSATGQMLISSHQGDLLIRRITWEYISVSGALPKVRIIWKDNRRSYLSQPALITAVFGRPGEDYPLSSPVRIEAGNTLSFEATSAQEEACEIDIVVHGVELRGGAS